MRSVQPRFALLLAALLCFAAGTAVAQGIPATLTHHGHLMNGDEPFNDTLMVRFILYPIGGQDAVFTEEQEVVFSNGFYSAILGDDSTNTFPDTLFDVGPLELEITIISGTDEFVLSPRQQLTAVPYAYIAYGTNGGPVIASQIDVRAEDGTRTPVVTSDGSWIGRALDGASIADNAITSTHILDRSIEGLDIQQGAIGNDHLKTESVTASTVANLNITTDKIANGAVTGLKVANDAIQAFHIQDGSVSSADIQNNSIVATDIRTHGGIYAHKTDLGIESTTKSILNARRIEVTATCKDANDLPLQGFCSTTSNTSNMVVGTAAANWSSNTAAAEFTCSYYNTSGATQDITAQIACIEVD